MVKIHKYTYLISHKHITTLATIAQVQCHVHVHVNTGPREVQPTLKTALHYV